MSNLVASTIKSNADDISSIVLSYDKTKLGSTGKGSIIANHFIGNPQNVVCGWLYIDELAILRESYGVSNLTKVATGQWVCTLMDVPTSINNQSSQYIVNMANNNGDLFGYHPHQGAGCFYGTSYFYMSTYASSPGGAGGAFIDADLSVAVTVLL